LDLRARLADSSRDFRFIRASLRNSEKLLREVELYTKTLAAGDMQDGAGAGDAAAAAGDIGAGVGAGPAQ
jgi:hypothetical protein